MHSRACALASDRVHTNAFSIAATVLIWALNMCRCCLLKSCWDVRVSGDLDYTRVHLCFSSFEVMLSAATSVVKENLQCCRDVG